METTKEQLINFIKQWIDTEDEIKVLQKQLKEKRSEKKVLTESLVDVMKTNDIDCFDINNGKLMYSQNKIKQPINKKLLLQTLSKYVSDADSINEITQHILDSRSIKLKDNLRFKE